MREMKNGANSDIIKNVMCGRAKDRIHKPNVYGWCINQ
jgi:hypothetical protein